ncbi:Asporin [Dissostichus eleginoides]|uniref:Asporin n=1 Tax=Dissostichus eleginoides TaxID=100907 RepID=A0AAD9FLG8_DISEL|nr:Asporin [Dissostichus eleginoides]
MDKLKQEKVEEERESRLVAGIGLHEEARREMITVNQQNVEEKGGNGGIEDHMVVSDLTPPFNTSSTQVQEELIIPATIQIITQSQNPPGVPPPDNHHNVPQSQVSSHPPTAYAKVSPQFFPPPVTLPSPTEISHMSASTVLPGSVLLLEDLLTEVWKTPGHHLKQKELEVKSSPHLEDAELKNILFKPARKEIQTTVVQPNHNTGSVQAATPKPKDSKFITKEVNPTPRSNENNAMVKLNPNMTQPSNNNTKPRVKQNRASPPQTPLTKVSAKPRQTTAKTPSAKNSSKNKTNKNSKEKKRKKDNKTQKAPPKKKVVKPTTFPYFKDNYCPPECACYGRVVQCSDKGVDKVPYGIPYNSRYILLMNNHIDAIQLDLLNEYVSMEFLVLSNNRLKDETIEGAFEGIPALKRLYLNKNLLISVPADLPVSLEELRLDNNHLSVMSEAAWARLRTLNLDHNQLTSVPLGLPLSIKQLYLKGNLIEQFRGGAFNGRSELMVLDLSSNRLKNKGLLKDSLLNATHLESLNLEGNRLKQVPQHLPSSLKTLNLEGNLISSIKKMVFGTLKNLEHLGLARNKIFKVAPGAFKTLPVLHQLDLCHNTLRQVPRQLPKALHSLALTHNKIQTVPRDAFCWGNQSYSLSGLVRVQLEHNLIDMGKLDAQAFRCLRGFQVVHFY